MLRGDSIHLSIRLRSAGASKLCLPISPWLSLIARSNDSVANMHTSEQIDGHTYGTKVRAGRGTRVPVDPQVYVRLAGTSPWSIQPSFSYSPMSLNSPRLALLDSRVPKGVPGS